MAHAPLYYEEQQQLQQQQQRSQEVPPPTTHAHPTRHHHHGGIPSYSRSTPPRHHVMSGDSTRSGSGSGRRKRHTGTHAPSNSGKVQLDLSTLGSAVGVGAAMGGTTPRSSPPLAPTLPCGVMLTSPLRRSSSGLYRAAMPCTTAPPPPPAARSLLQIDHRKSVDCSVTNRLSLPSHQRLLLLPQQRRH